MDVIRLLAIREHPLSVDEVLTAITDPRAGGTCLFVGTVREVDGGRDVTSLGYEAHPLVTDKLREVAERVVAEVRVRAVAVVHRVGRLEIGDAAVIVGVAAEHRQEAFDACRRLIDDLKREAPIWKHQMFGDGTDEWVGSP